MDKKFFQKIKDSGCSSLSFGVESGSQKVLDDMRKKIEVCEIENNLKHGKEVGICNHVNWMFGFPTEEPVDFFHSLQTLFNTRNHIHCISPGFTTAIAKNSHIDTDQNIYNIVIDYKVSNDWYTEGFKNTILHRFLRLKLAHVWLEIIKTNTDGTMFNTQRHDDIINHYNFTPSKKNTKKYIKQDFNVNFNQFGEEFRGTILNEYVGFIYLLYKYFGKFSFVFRCDPESDVLMFGNHLTQNYNCELIVDVKPNGEFSFNIYHCYNAPIFGFEERIYRRGTIKDWITEKPQLRQTIHKKR